jgi:hypothetical protein
MLQRYTTRLGFSESVHGTHFKSASKRKNCVPCTRFYGCVHRFCVHGTHFYVKIKKCTHYFYELRFVYTFFIRGKIVYTNRMVTVALRFIGGVFSPSVGCAVTILAAQIASAQGDGRLEWGYRHINNGTGCP